MNRLPENPAPPAENSISGGLRLPNLQQHVKLSAEQREKLGNHSIRRLWEGFFGQGTPAANFLTNITNWAARALGIEGRPPTHEEIFGMIDAQADAATKSAIEAGFVAHRGNGYEFHYSNTAAGLEAVLRRGGRPEFDVRKGPNGLCLSHGPVGSNPMEGGTSFAEALEILRRYPTPFYLDIKGGAETTTLIIQAMLASDAAMQNTSGFVSLLSRAALMAFNPDALPVIRNLAPHCPIIFHYFPTGGYAVLDNVLLPAYQRGLISHGHIESALGTVDRLGNTHLQAEFSTVSLHVNDQSPFSRPGSSPSEERLTTYSLLPPVEIMNMVRASGGAISVPWPLVRDWPEFFVAARGSGVRLAIFGFEEPVPPGATRDQARAATLRHNRAAREAIALGANIIISDHPESFTRNTNTG